MLYVYYMLFTLTINLICCLMFALEKIMDASYYLDKILDYYKVYEYQDLIEKLGVSQQTISNWKTRNSINSIVKKCKQLGIYEDIFNFNDKNIQKINNVNGGQVAQNVHGNQTHSAGTSPSKEITADDATYNLFEEAYNKALDNNDLKGFRIHLMDY